MGARGGLRIYVIPTAVSCAESPEEMGYFGPALGIAGLATCGPLMATLLIGRTGAVPSVRWAGLVAATWLIAGGASWAVTAGRPLRERLAPLAPLAALSPLLIAAYLSDRDFHLLRLAARQVVALEVALLALGVAAALPAVQRQLSAPGSAEAARHVVHAWAPSTTAPLAGVALMLFLNDALLEALGSHQPVPADAVLPLALICAAVPALAACPESKDVGGAAGLVALLGFAATAAAWLSIGPPGMVAAVSPVIAALALVFAAQRGFWPVLSDRAAVLCGALLVLGFAAALTSEQRFGLAAHELVTRVPDLPFRLPLGGTAALTAALAVRAAAPAYPSRSAAIGGIRDA